MANPTYLALVNKVLQRLRENTVSALTGSTYALLLGEFLNMSKTDVEAAWTWHQLRQTKTIAVLGDSSTVRYSLTGAGTQFKVLSAWNTTTKAQLIQKSEAEMDALAARVPAAQVPASQITYFCFRQPDGSGDTQVDIYPAATQAQTLSFNLYIPQADLANDGDQMSVPWKPVVEMTYAMAIAERGEDGGIPSQVQDARAKRILSDAIYDDMAITGDDEQQFSAQAPVGTISDW